MIFPWRADNHFELLRDGPQFFPPMLTAIARASRQVELELYLVASGACTNLLIAALCQAAQRGVAVRCLLDGFGSLAYLPRNAPNYKPPGLNCGFTIRCVGGAGCVICIATTANCSWSMVSWPLSAAPVLPISFGSRRAIATRGTR